MNKQALMGMRNHFRQVHGVTIRAMDMLPADKIDTHPVANMRTPRELMIHTYMYLGAISESILKGSLTAEDTKEPLDTVKTKADLLSYARAQFQRADQAVAKITDAQLQGMVTTMWGPTMPGFAMMGVIQDEHVHHRGQLYAYLRAMGQEPPFMWGFENNEAELQPAKV